VNVKRLALFAVLLGIGVRLACDGGEPETPLRIATFNIERFPRSQRQIDGAFAELAALDAPIIAVQEIADPGVFVAGMRDQLGAAWQIAFEPFIERGYLHTGVLFDRRRFALLSTATHDGTMLGGKHKRVLEVRLAPVAGGTPLRVLVVHLKSRSDGRDIRAQQHVALRAIVRAAVASGERVAVLGDFNATEDIEDRDDLAALAEATGLAWATEPLACSAFWRRDDGCPRSRLDHVFTWRAGTATAKGACESAGCDREDRCPAYSREVSDHCPVVVELR